MKHKHYDLICTKAASMSLVVFCKIKDETGWIELELGKMPEFKYENEYFLCYSQHKASCLHWLNGGDVQVSTTGNPNIYEDFKGFDVYGEWSKGTIFMDEYLYIRIKPKKVKRWIGVNSSGYATPMTFISEDECDSYVAVSYPPSSSVMWQFIEIEVEA
jgi:hypothetical protein